MVVTGPRADREQRLPAAVAGLLRYAGVSTLLGGAVAWAVQAAATGPLPPTTSLDTIYGRFGPEAVEVDLEKVWPGPPRSGPNFFSKQPTLPPLRSSKVLSSKGLRTENPRAAASTDFRIERGLERGKSFQRRIGPWPRIDRNAFQRHVFSSEALA